MTKAIKLQMDNSQIRLDKWLANRLPRLSRNQIANLIKAGLVSVEGRSTVKARDILEEGREILVDLDDIEDKEKLKAQELQLEIIFEDRDFLVINKPAGLAVHPGAGNPDGTLVNGLLYYLGDELSDLSGPDRPGIVHRLDKGTGGLLLVCKNNEIHGAMAELFQKHQVRRVYRALVWGQPEKKEGTIEAPLARNPRKRTQMAVVHDGKYARSHYRLVRTFVNSQNQVQASELELSLYTGRTHQLRVHLAHVNLPIIGDPVYHGGRPRLGLANQALYSSELAFRHPLNGLMMDFKIEAPTYYQEALVRLEELNFKSKGTFLG